MHLMNCGKGKRIRCISPRITNQILILKKTQLLYCIIKKCQVTGVKIIVRKMKNFSGNHITVELR